MEVLVEKKPNHLQLWIFVYFLSCGLIALGPIQWGSLTILGYIRDIYRIGVPIIFLVLTITFNKHERLNHYWRVTFGFFIASFAFFIPWLVSQFLKFPTNTVDGFTLEKLKEATSMIISIVLLTILSHGSMDSIYLSKGNVKLGLLIGGVTFTGFAILSIPGSILLFAGQNLILERVISWTPWLLASAIANAIMEELIYRGLFLKQYMQFLGAKITIVLQSLIFTFAHFGAYYTTEHLLFLAILFLLGLAWGYIMQRTDSLLGSVLFHAGTDLAVFMGIFSTF